VYANPFTQARDELYQWMERANMPIDQDGYFLAYKVVNSDYMDRHSRTFRNQIGDTPTMHRINCDNTSRNLCSSGLHFCSADYLPSFGVHEGDHVMIIRINPADVVSIPKNETAKGRTWTYEVVGEISYEEVGIREWLPVDTSWDADEDEGVFGVDDDYDDDFDGDPSIDVETIFVNTKQFGPMSFDEFVEKYVRAGSTNAGLAKALGVPAGTVGKWLAKFRQQGCELG
jgi:hypothetical protein